jgi:hypothetical protein
MHVVKHYKKELFLSFLLLSVYSLIFKAHNCMNTHDEQQHTPEQARRRHRRRDSHSKRKSASSMSLNNNYGDDVVSETKIEEISKNSLHHSSDSDGETDTTVIRPWTPTTYHIDGISSPDQNANNDDNDNNNSPTLTPALRSLFETITEDLDKFVYTPAPNGLGDIQCRITRDKRGMEKGLFPTYYMHVERPGDGKKVCHSY